MTVQTDYQWFGEFIADQRERVYGWSQEECAKRVEAYYAALPPDPALKGRSFRFTRSSWSKMECNRQFKRVREKTVLHASIGLLLPFSTCMAVAGYRTDPVAADDPARRLGEAIRVAREMRGLDVYSAAHHVGVAPLKYTAWESGSAVPDGLQVPRLAHLLGVTPNDLYGVHSPGAPHAERSVGYDPVSALRILTDYVHSRTDQPDLARAG